MRCGAVRCGRQEKGRSRVRSRDEEALVFPVERLASWQRRALLMQEKENEGGGGGGILAYKVMGKICKWYSLNPRVTVAATTMVIGFCQP